MCECVGAPFFYSTKPKKRRATVSKRMTSRRFLRQVQSSKVSLSVFALFPASVWECVVENVICDSDFGLDFKVNINPKLECLRLKIEQIPIIRNSRQASWITPFRGILIAELIVSWLIKFYSCV